MFILTIPRISISKDFEKKWTAIPGAKFYEFELAIDKSFSADGLMMQSRVDRPEISLSLQSGTYYLRVRAISENGEAKAWIPSEKIFIGAQATAFRSPSNGSRIQILGPETPIRIEWETVNGAEEYELISKNLSSNTEKKFKSKVPSVAVTEVGAGNLQITVVALRRGEVLSKSAPLDIIVEFSSNPRPRFLEPKNDDILGSYEISRIRWIRGTPNSDSEIEIRSLSRGGKLISKENLDSDDSSYFPALPSGRYQISVRETNKKATSLETVTVLVQDDPMHRSSRSLGQNLRMLNQLNFGWDAIQNDGSYSGWLRNQENIGVLTEIRAAGRLYQEWGYEAIYNIRFNNPSIQRSNGSNGDSYTESLQGNYLDSAAYLGPSLQSLVLGPLKPLTLKALLAWSRLKYPTYDGTGPLATANSNQFHSSDFRRLSLRIGADLQWGGWSRSWDLLGQSFLEFPVWVWGTNVKSKFPAPIPAFDLRIFARRKLFYGFRLNLGMFMNLERLEVNKKTSSQNSVLRSRGTYGLILGLETEF